MLEEAKAAKTYLNGRIEKLEEDKKNGVLQL